MKNDKGFEVGRPSKVTDEVRDRIRGMYSRGESVRGIEVKLKAEGIDLHYSSISRIVSPPPDRRNGTPRAARATAPLPSASSPLAAQETSKSEPVVEEPIEMSDDPRELAREDWLYYERQKILLRRQADDERKKDNLRGYRDLLREARIVEERAAELRPPVPPDPQSDPAYLAASRDLVSYIEALVARAEQGEPIPPRTFVAIEPA